MDTIYKRIRYRRQELGMTVEELSRRMGYKDKSSISKIENGKADIPQSKVVAFAAALHTTPAYLMGWEEQPEATPPQPETSLTLTPVEESLVTDYRRLTPPGQEYIRQTMAMALQSYSEKNHPVSELETAL